MLVLRKYYTAKSFNIFYCQSFVHAYIIYIYRMHNVVLCFYHVFSGCEDGTICIHDVRQKEALVTSTQRHTLEVCGLKWTTDGQFLASGSNDNAIYIWNLPSSREPVHRLTEHTSAVKVHLFDVLRV